MHQKNKEERKYPKLFENKNKLRKIQSQSKKMAGTHKH
jgi:hypothetical protein